MDDYVKRKLQEWVLSEYIDNFKGQQISETNFKLLLGEEKAQETLIPPWGPRLLFKKKLGELCNNEIEPSTSKMLSPCATSTPGKRNTDEANPPIAKRHCGTSLGRADDMTKGKQIMKRVRGKLQSKPADQQSSLKFKEFLSHKIKVLETDKKEVVGVFGKTGAGKSYLINSILDQGNLLPSGDVSACTSVMIQVEANMTRDGKYTAEIEFITQEEWEEELQSILAERKSEEGNDDEKEDSDGDTDEYDDADKIYALYREDGNEASVNNLMDSRHFKSIPEFLSGKKKEFKTSQAEELSRELWCYLRSDIPSNEQQYWPLVKSVTIKIPNVKDLLEHIVLIDLPGNGDCNKSRDEMWKSVVGRCTTVWIVSEINRPVSEKEAWEILDRSVSYLGHGGQCRSISFICTKTDNICVDDDMNKERDSILSRNKVAKKKVEEKFNKQPKIKVNYSAIISCLEKNPYLFYLCSYFQSPTFQEHFNIDKDFFQVFTVSSKEYRKNSVLQPEDTEIPKLQEFLRNLNDRRTKTSDYVSGAYGILSLIQGAKSSDMTDRKKEVCQVLENNLKEGLETIGQSMDEAYEAFERCLSEGVRQSVETCEKIAKDKVIEPKGRNGRGYHKVLKSLCKNNGVYKPIRKKGKKRQMEINLNDSLASCMRDLSNETFKKYFPNQGKGSSINDLIDNFTLDTNSLVEEHPEVSLHLTFLKTEETKLKAKLKRDIRERKKEIYNILPKSISDTMRPCYERAAQYTGTDSLESMRKELRNHLKTFKEEMFHKAKKEMLDLLKEMKKHIVEELEHELQESMSQSLKTPDNLLVPDVSEEYEEMKKCYETLPSSTNATTTTA
ncbi:nuclear GTPase SLIP-GC isoform X3 [Salmo salar]|uniref:Nuclear GTPase SLIP-GC isoform X3 n=1 Tax=Salmo salar TaxID=8030 RepID=A0ABM3EKJ2_SALSA|nr:nuclear GTPase SLIP-GC isoform X3 [Salmo salar]